MRAYSKHTKYAMKRRALLNSIMGLVLFLTSCGVKTPPQSEDLQKEAFKSFALPSTWQSSSSEITKGDTTTAHNWLGSFNDRTLNSLVAEALEHNLDLQISSNRIEQADGYVALAKADLRPALSILGRAGTNMANDFNLGITGGLLGASWEIDLWGKLRNAKAASIETYEATQEDFNAAQLSIAANVVKNWYNAAEIFLEIKLAEEVVQTNSQLADLAKKRYEIGIGNKIDLEIALANLNSFIDAQKKLLLAYNNTIRAIEVLAGRYPATDIEVNQDLIKIENEIPVGIPAQILVRRPDLRAAEKRFDAAFHRTEQAKSSRWPNLKLAANFGAISSTFLRLKNFDNPISGGSVSAGMPIYQGGAVDATIAIKTAEQKQAINEYARAVLNALNEVECAINATNLLNEREHYLELSVKSSESAYKLEQQLYDVGETDMRTVSEQQLSYISNKMTLLRVQNEKITQRINLFLALGGSL